MIRKGAPQRLYLPSMAAKLARDAIRLNVEYDYGAVELGVVSQKVGGGSYAAPTRPEASRSPR